jgi:hypothetical protein
VTATAEWGPERLNPSRGFSGSRLERHHELFLDRHLLASPWVSGHPGFSFLDLEHAEIS